jgi:hypothetical protein
MAKLPPVLVKLSCGHSTKVAKCESMAALISYSFNLAEADQATPGLQSRSPQAKAAATEDR